MKYCYFWTEEQVSEYLKRLDYHYNDENQMYSILKKLGFQWNEEDENYVVPDELYHAIRVHHRWDE